jgi:tripartite-type tricarboxylate transporter receptor subunit TctC
LGNGCYHNEAVAENMRCTRREALGSIALGLAGGLLLPAGFRAFAQGALPAQPIRFIVPFSAGGTADVLARAIGAKLQTNYGLTVIVENRPGAAGNIGADVVAKARPDGSMIVLGTIGIHAAYSLYRKLSYDPAKDLRPIVVLGEVPCVLVVHPSRPFNDLDQFLAYAKQNPGKLTYGSAGVGSATHLVGELFQQASSVKLAHIPYRGSSMAMNDLMAGQIDLMFELVTTAAPIIKAGNIRALGVTSRARSEVLPDVATISELAIPGFDATGWFTVATGAGVPDAIVGTFNRDINEILRSSDLQDMWNSLALAIIGGSPEQASEFFGTEREKWAKVIATANIHIE